MAVVKSWRTPDARWLVDRVTGEPGIGYRLGYEGMPVGDLPDDPGALRGWLAARHVEVAERVALPADEDPFCEQRRGCRRVQSAVLQPLSLTGDEGAHRLLTGSARAARFHDLALPCDAGELDWVPGAAQRRGVGHVEVA